MRNFIIGAAALLAVALPGVAMAQTGYVDLSYANATVDAGGGDEDANGWNAGGVVAFDAHALGIQLDADVGSLDADGADDSDFWNIGGHVYKRNASHLIGVFANVGNVDSGGGDSNYYSAGVEGRIYLAQTTLGAAVSYTEADDADVNVTALDLGVRHFLSDNFALDGNVGIANAETTGADADVISYGVGAEYQLASMPISIFGGYQHGEIDDFDVDTDTLSVGVRYNWGGTLFDRDRSGAGLGRRSAGVLGLF